MQQATDTAAFSAALKSVLVGGGIGPDWDAAADEWMDVSEGRQAMNNDATEPTSKRHRQGLHSTETPSWSYIGRHPAEQTESAPESNEERLARTPSYEPLQNVYVGKPPAVTRQTRRLSACSTITRHCPSEGERSPSAELPYRLRSRKTALSKATR